MQGAKWTKYIEIDWSAAREELKRCRVHTDAHDDLALLCEVCNTELEVVGWPVSLYDLSCQYVGHLNDKHPVQVIGGDDGDPAVC